MSVIENSLGRIKAGNTLSADETGACIRALMTQQVDPAVAKDFLSTLAARGETADEITGAARVLRDLAIKIAAPADCVDCCGTGGDGANTYNISTAVALVCAACGVPMAKHGNRSASSQSGAADVLEKLGVTLDLPPATLEQALRTIGFCFLMATNHHKAMKNVAPLRRELGTRTIFNLLGPLANPAQSRRQLLGVFQRKWLLPMAQALKDLGSERALIVHGSDGLDEITLTGPTYAIHLHDGSLSEMVLNPDDFGLPLINGDDIRGGDADHNARALLAVLNGEQNAYRHMVLANAAAVLYIHGTTDNLKDGVSIAASAIDSGKSLDILEQYRKIGA